MIEPCRHAHVPTYRRTDVTCATFSSKHNKNYGRASRHMSSSSCSLPTHGGSRHHKLPPPPPSPSWICCCGISKYATRTLSWNLDKNGAPSAPPSSPTWPSPAKRGRSWDVTFALAQLHGADLVPLSWLGALGIGNGTNGDRPPYQPRACWVSVTA